MISSCWLKLQVFELQLQVVDTEEEENDQKRMGAAHEVASNVMDIEESED